MVKIINRKMLGTVSLALATFLNPLGFDILVYKLTQLTNDYWHTMHILYASAALFFGFSFFAFKLGGKALGNGFLTIALFLNPFGYDLIVYYINSVIKDYWMTMSFMYVLTGIFFALFLYFYNINPVEAFSYHAKKTHKKLKTKMKKNG